MEERRKLRRRHLIYYLRVFDRNTDELVGHLVDVTTEGVMLMSEDPFGLGPVYQLRMVLPEAIEGSTQVHFDAKCIWCREGIAPGFYDSGFDLLAISREHKQEIERLIVEYGFQD